MRTPPALEIPAAYAADIALVGGAAGSAWLDALPALVAGLCAAWRLTLDGPPWHGWLGLVLPVRRDEERLVLKVAWPGDTAHEARALAAWDGRGAVRLLETDPASGALLLERLDQHSLEDVPIDEAVFEAARLVRRLAIPAPPDVPALREVAGFLADDLPRRWDVLGTPFPRSRLDRAVGIARELGPAAGDRLVNYDLHYGNVLAGTREPWLVIDPKVVAGDPEYGVGQLLWTRFDDMATRRALRRHLDVLIDVAGLDAERVRLWSIVRIVDYWLWALGAGLTEDPARCAAILDRLDA